MSGRAPCHAVVLAGSRGPADPVAAAAGVSVKAFAAVGGRPMIERVVGALRDSGAVDAVTVCLDAGAPVGREAPALAADLEAGRVQRMDPAAGPSRSVLHALERVPAHASLLVATADHALLTPAMVRAFAEGGARAGADAAIGLTRFDAVERAHPGAVRTRLRFRDASYSSCNLFLFRGRRARAAIGFWQRLEVHRKSPVRLAAQIGPGTLIGYLCRRWTAAQALARLGRRVGVTLAPVVLTDPEAAIDVDTPQDLELARSIVARRGAG